MHFIRAGSGSPALVFVHGFACTHEDWRAQLEHFQRSHEVLACDLRGHGRTPGRPHECSIEHYGGDVAALVNNLELARVVLPTSNITNVAFGGPDLATLFITSATADLSDAQRASQPLAGALFAVTTDAVGIAPHCCAL